MSRRRSGIIALCLLSLTQAAAANEPRPSEADFYPLTTFQPPPDVVLEAAGMQLMPDGRLAVCTRRGEIWMVSDPLAKSVGPDQFQLFAQGLHEPLSLAERDGWLYVVQRCDVSRLRDEDGDGRADVYEVFNDDWEITGDYHEYAFGSKFDEAGDLWITLCLTGSFSSEAAYRGWCVRIRPDGKLIPTASGIRSPAGMAQAPNGAMFYTDNQGPWNGTCSLKLLRPGGFAGHPGGWNWYSLTQGVMTKPRRAPTSGSRFVIEADALPELDPPVVMFPYKKMGQSASGICVDRSQGKFGPFDGQLFVGDVTFSTVMRVSLEQVHGRHQGACYPFREGLASGVVGVEMSSAGAMFVGGTSRGWGARGSEPFSLQRIDFAGRTPFELQEMSIQPDGFLLRFTQPVDVATANDPASYKLETYTYIYQESYGSPEVDHTHPAVAVSKVSEDGLTVRIAVSALQRGHVHELRLPGLRARDGAPLLHNTAYYTANELP